MGEEGEEVGGGGVLGKGGVFEVGVGGCAAGGGGGGGDEV